MGRLSKQNKNNPKKIDVLNKLVLHPRFRNTIDDINKLNIKILNPQNKEMDFQSYSFPPNGELVTTIEEIKPYDMNLKNGERLANSEIGVSAYDESVNNYSTLEGEAYLTSHSLVILSQDEYVPVNLLTLYFYTRAQSLSKNSESIRYSNTPEVESKKDYFDDKIKFLTAYVPDNSLLFIDGPLIGGDYYIKMIQAINSFVDKNIIPIFFVKNSDSNLVTNNVLDYQHQFNSDMHWAYRFLKRGQRTNFFKYVDRYNKENAKIFCYLKALDISPQRVEFPAQVFSYFSTEVLSIMDLIYYFLIAQGDRRNLQIRPIAISEKYAREALKLVDLSKLMKESGLVPTMNEGRGFAW
jgi:hypothetical protein